MRRGRKGKEGRKEGKEGEEPFQHEGMEMNCLITTQGERRRSRTYSLWGISHPEEPEGDQLRGTQQTRRDAARLQSLREPKETEYPYLLFQLL